MEADFAVELAAEDETLEFPWAAGEGGPRYYDLKSHPELLLSVPEAQRVAALGEFLASINSPPSILETAKCDTWGAREMNPEEKIFGAAYKFGSYVDLLFSGERRYAFSAHEDFARQLVNLLKRVPEIPAAAEFLLRRAYYHENRGGFYITFYLFGYGDDEPQARQRWAIALKLVENAIRQLSQAQP